MKQLALTFTLGFSLLISACGVIEPYRFEIPQGNALEQEKLEQVKIGMTPNQVEFLMGTPSIQDAFSKDRWDYVYHNTDSKRQTSKRIVTILFTSGKVSSIKDSDQAK